MIKVLVLVGHYWPGYKGGGALRSVYNMVEHLKDEFELYIITSDRDRGDVGPYSNVSIDEWNDIGGARVYYASPRMRAPRNFIKLIESAPHDILYLNSFFEPLFTIAPLIARCINRLSSGAVILAPRGEFTAGALRVKRFKKFVYILVAKFLGVYRDIVWQASTDMEAQDIHRVMGGIAGRVVVAPDLPRRIGSEPEQDDFARYPGEPLRVCYLSRIAPVKNLDFALSVLAQVDVPVIFDIYGPKEDAEYWVFCEQLKNNVKHPVEVNYKGAVHNDHVSGVLGRYNLLFLPSRGENFGHVIMEAMLVGTPVLISDATPWRNLSELGVGWDCPLTKPESFVAAIKQVYLMPSAEYLNMRSQARLFSAKMAQNQGVVEANRNLFKQVLV